MPRIKLSKDILSVAIDKAVDALQGGAIIAFPTETFYGLGAKYDLSDTLKRLYELKRRPREKALPLIIGSREMLGIVSSLDRSSNASLISSASLLMDRFWPGPLTLLVPAKEGLSDYVAARTGMVAVRIPGESFALRLAKKARFPITATSANPSGLPAAAEAEDVENYFGNRIDLLIDGGAAPGGLPSTIVDLSGGMPRILREGAISRKEIKECMSQK
jgi:L-threonylcarbamoyladenylate synthase